MKYNEIGESGLRVSEICLGTMTFGTEYYNIGELESDQASRLVKRSIELGVNFFDTADVYSQGQSEKILGTAIKSSEKDRDKFVIATKVRNAMSSRAKQGKGDVNNLGLSRKHIMEGCKNSLRRLDTDYIDLYQVHGWDHQTPIEESLRTLNDLVRQGMVRYIGCSNWNARHIMKAKYLCEANGWESFISVQAYYNCVARDLEHEVTPLCQEEGLGVLPWSPLAGGYLTGKFRRDRRDPEDARRSDYDFPPIDRELAFKTVDVMEEIAREEDCTIPQVALSWLRHQAVVPSVIIGARRIEQLEENMGAAELELTEKQLRRISSLTEPGDLYPQWMVQRHDRPDSFEYESPE